MNKQAVVYAHYELLLSNKNELPTCPITWMSLKGTMLNEKVNLKRLYIAQLHLYNILKVAKLL